MKLATKEAALYCRKPDPAKAGMLIYGGDAMRVALRRQEVIAALVGPQGEAEMRLTRMSGGDLRKDPAMLLDAVTAQGFFPGPRVAFVEDATDGIAPVFASALSDWRPGDAQIIVSAGALTAKSALRKVFEDHRNAYALGIYDEPPDRHEVEAAVAAAGLRDVGRDAMEAIIVLSRTLDPGDFRQTVEKIGLYKAGDTAPLTVAEVDLSAPQSTEAGLDDLLAVVADGKPGALLAVLRRLDAQGVTPVGLCIGATRHFRALHTIACDPGGPAAGVGRLRPPAFGARRDALVRQATQWGRPKLEDALVWLTETDLALRSSGRAPQQALMERTLIRLAMRGQR